MLGKWNLKALLPIIMKKLKPLSLLCFIALLTSCGDKDGDPAELNDGTAKAAINAYYEENPAALRLTVNFPVSLANNARKAQALLPLVSAGILTTSDTEVRNPDSLARMKTEKVPGKIFDLSSKGRELVVSVDEGSGGFGKVTMIRLADYEVNEITVIGEPADEMGRLMSQVNYTYSSKNHDTSLVDSAEVQKAHPGIKNTLGQNKEGKAFLVKTNKGWVHEKLMR